MAKSYIEGSTTVYNKNLTLNDLCNKITSIEDKMKIVGSSGIIEYKNTTTTGSKWSYARLVNSSHSEFKNMKWDSGMQGLMITGANHILVSGKVCFQDGTYSYNADVTLVILSNGSAWKNISIQHRGNWYEYYIPAMVIAVPNTDVTVYLAKYTDSNYNKLITTDEVNYLCVTVLD